MILWPHSKHLGQHKLLVKWGAENGRSTCSGDIPSGVSLSGPHQVSIGSDGMSTAPPGPQPHLERNVSSRKRKWFSLEMSRAEHSEIASVGIQQGNLGSDSGPGRLNASVDSQIRGTLRLFSPACLSLSFLTPSFYQKHKYRFCRKVEDIDNQKNKVSQFSLTRDNYYYNLLFFPNTFSMQMYECLTVIFHQCFYQEKK